MIQQEQLNKTYKSVAFRFVSNPVGDDHGFLNLSILVKMCLQCVISCVVRQSSNEQLCHSGVAVSHSRCRHSYKQKKGITLKMEITPKAHTETVASGMLHTLAVSLLYSPNGIVIGTTGSLFRRSRLRP